MKLSKSKIGIWEKCPFLYKLLYIDNSLKESPKSPAMERGIKIHEVFDKLSTPECKDEKVFIKTAKAIPESYEYKDAIINLLKFNRKWGFPIFREEKLEDKKYGIDGIIDRVSIRDGKIILWDYKSGQSHPINKYRFELALYTYLFEINHNQKVDFWGIYFLDKDVEVIEAVDRKIMQKAIDKVLAIRKEIEECQLSGKFIKKPKDDCIWCSALVAGLCDGEED